VWDTQGDSSYSNSLSTITVTVRCGLPGQVTIVVYAVTHWRIVCLNYLRGALITDILLYLIMVIEYNDGREIVSLIKTLSYQITDNLIPCCV